MVKIYIRTYILVMFIFKLFCEIIIDLGYKVNH